MDTERHSMKNVEHLLQKIERNGRAKKEEVCHKSRKTIDGKKIQVRFRYTMIRVGDIESVSQQFKAYFYLEASWREPTLKGKKLEDVDWDDEWDPRIKFMNILTLDEYTTHHRLKFYGDDPVPEVRLGMHVTGTFKENLELHDFPFDYQNLTIQVESSWPTTQVEFAKDKTYKDCINTHTFTDYQSWELQPFVISEVRKPPKREAREDRDYPMYDIKATVVRKARYYMWNMAFVMFLILLLTFTSLAVDPMELGERLSVTLTLLLTSVAFKFVVSQSLPAVSYLTFLDKYVLFCMVFQALVAVQNACTIFLPDREKTARTYDKVCAGVLLAILIISDAIFLSEIIVKVTCRDRKIKYMDEEYKYLCARIGSRSDDDEPTTSDQGRQRLLMSDS